MDALAHEHPGPGVCTAYEVGTALALDHFARSGVDVAVLEVGLGGRLDATNIVAADIAVIASISYDHTAILGETLAAIAREKAGIVKPGRPILSAPQHPDVLAVLERIAAERGAPLGVGGRTWTWRGDHASLTVEAAAAPGLWRKRWRLGGLRIPLRGAHQLENAATAVAAARALDTVVAARAGACTAGVPAETIARGLAATRWPARFEVVRPRRSGGVTVVVDGAHNGDSAAKLAAALRATYRARRVWLVLGVTRDKDLTAIIAPLAPLATGAWAAAAHHPRSRPADDVAAALQDTSLTAQVAPSVAAAMRSALAGAQPRDVVCVTGSLFVAAEAREALGLVPPPARDPEIL